MSVNYVMHAWCGSFYWDANGIRATILGFCWQGDGASNTLTFIPPAAAYTSSAYI